MCKRRMEVVGEVLASYGGCKRCVSVIRRLWMMCKRRREVVGDVWHTHICK